VERNWHIEYLRGRKELLLEEDRLLLFSIVWEEFLQRVFEKEEKVVSVKESSKQIKIRWHRKKDQ
jgi:hypothetical protein